ATETTTPITAAITTTFTITAGTARTTTASAECHAAAESATSGATRFGDFLDFAFDHLPFCVVRDTELLAHTFGHALTHFFGIALSAAWAATILRILRQGNSGATAN
ncbi:MAG: hypothetical protein ACXW32_17955, partial [Limisphaerales bacterium]